MVSPNNNGGAQLNVLGTRTTTAGHTTRRTLLKLAGAGLSASLAGCMGVLSTNSLADLGNYTAWLPSPDEIYDSTHYFAFLYDPPGILDAEDRFSNGTFDALEATIERAAFSELSVDEIDSLLIIGNRDISVFTGNFDITKVVEEIDSDVIGLDDEGEYKGVKVHISEDGTSAIGAAEGLLAIVQGGADDPDDILETVIDTKRGDEDRYADENEDCKLLTEEVGRGAITVVETRQKIRGSYPERGQFDDSVGWGYRWEFNGETTQDTTVIPFDSERDVDLDDLRDWVEANSGTSETFDGYNEVTYEQKGRLAILKGTIDTEDLHPYQLPIF